MIKTSPCPACGTQVHPDEATWPTTCVVCSASLLLRRPDRDVCEKCRMDRQHAGGPSPSEWSECRPPTPSTPSPPSLTVTRQSFASVRGDQEGRAREGRP